MKAVNYFDEMRLNADIIMRFHGAFRCPVCEMPIPLKQHERFVAGKRIKCVPCGKFFTYRTGTPFAGSKLTSGQLVLLEAMLSAGAEAKVIASMLELTIDTVLNWQTKFEVLHVRH